MRHLIERLMQTVFLSAGFPFSRLFSFRWPPEINSMKWDCIPGFRERRKAAEVFQGACVGCGSGDANYESTGLTRNV
jgi:hypothetical protein